MLRMIISDSNLPMNVCQSSFSEYVQLQGQGQWTNILVGLLVITLVCILLTNVSVIYAIVSLRLQDNPSMRLKLILCSADLGVALLTIPLNIAVLYGKGGDCNLEKIADFFAVISRHYSPYIICCVGHDRYIRMKYLNEYSTIMTTTRVHVEATIGLLVILLFSCAHVLVADSPYYRDFVCMMGIADIGLFICILAPYALVVYVLKMHRRHAFNRQILSDVEATVRRTCLMIATAIVHLYSGYYLLSLVRAFVDRTQVFQNQVMAFLWLLSSNVLYVNSVVKPLIFLHINEKCRHKLLAFVFGRCGFTNNSRVENERTTSV